MSAFNLYHNKDLSFIRSVIIGLLSNLKNKIKYDTQLGEEELNIKTQDINFYFSTTGSERYLNDKFLNSVDFDPNYILSETFYNEIPRGIIEFKSIAIESDSITNKRVRTTHRKIEKDGSLNSYNSETFFIPLKLNFDISIYVNNILDQLKITESVITNLYKNNYFEIEKDFNLIQCVASLPEDFENESPIEFGFSDKKEYKIMFNIELRTYLPVFIKSSTLFEGNRIDKMVSSVKTIKDNKLL